MRVGLLWYDADRKKSVKEKIDEALKRYVDKFDDAPNTCHVNPSDVQTHPRLRVVPDRFVQPNNFWLGYEEEQQAVGEAAAS